ncbi:MAG: YceI family protein [Bacteroidia bacterium]
MQKYLFKCLMTGLVIGVLCAGCQPSGQNQAEQSAVKEERNGSSVEFHKLIGKDYLLDDQHSYIGFKIKYFGFSPVRGRFDEFDGTAFYDPDQSYLSVSLFIDVKSINTGNEQRDEDLTQTPEWFAADSFPQIIFQSTHTRFREDGGFDLKGNLTIKGKTQEVIVPFIAPTPISRDWAGNEQVDFSGRLTINRQDFGVNGNEFWSTVMENGLTQLSDEVELEIDIHARRADYIRRYADLDSSDIRKKVIDAIMNQGLEEGMKLIENIHREAAISEGNFSTIGYCLISQGKYAEAKEIFQKKLDIYPESVAGRTQIGIGHLFLGEMEEARNRFNEVLTRSGNDSRATEYLRHF